VSLAKGCPNMMVIVDTDIVKTERESQRLRVLYTKGIERKVLRGSDERDV
jgi:hypothetical protein